MPKPFRVKAFNPGTGQSIDMILVAEDLDEARRKAEECGLRNITVAEAPVPEGPAKTDPQGGGASEPRPFLRFCLG